MAKDSAAARKAQYRSEKKGLRSKDAMKRREARRAEIIALGLTFEPVTETPNASATVVVKNTKSPTQLNKHPVTSMPASKTDVRPVGPSSWAREGGWRASGNDTWGKQDEATIQANMELRRKYLESPESLSEEERKRAETLIARTARKQEKKKLVQEKVRRSKENKKKNK